MQILRSTSDSPAINSTFEEYLLTESPLMDFLLFYINRPSVIVGRNQQIEAEVNINYCRQYQIEIFKRLSGGGTVYQDYGNINYAFITCNDAIPILDKDFATPMLAALQSFGVMATIGKRKELLVRGKKISGTASHITRSRILFHGTLLHRVDLNHLSLALQGDLSLRQKKIASIPSPVINLSELINSTESTSHFLNRLLFFFSQFYQTKNYSSISSLQDLISLNLKGKGRSF